MLTPTGADEKDVHGVPGSCCDHVLFVVSLAVSLQFAFRNGNWKTAYHDYDVKAVDVLLI